MTHTFVSKFRKLTGLRHSFQYYYNQYAPWKVVRRYLARFIYYVADKKYGVEARGEVKGIKVTNHPVMGKVGRSDLTDEQREKIRKWQFWMRFKNKINGPI